MTRNGGSIDVPTFSLPISFASSSSALHHSARTLCNHPPLQALLQLLYCKHFTPDSFPCFTNNIAPSHFHVIGKLSILFFELRKATADYFLISFFITAPLLHFQYHFSSLEAQKFRNLNKRCAIGLTSCLK